MCKHLEEDTEFALSIAVQHDAGVELAGQDGHMPEDDLLVDQEFDDDLAMSPGALGPVALGLTAPSVGELKDDQTVTENEEGEFMLWGGVDDDELSDTDADGDTDPDYDPKDDNQAQAQEQSTSTSVDS